MGSSQIISWIISSGSKAHPPKATASWGSLLILVCSPFYSVCFHFDNCGFTFMLLSENMCKLNFLTAFTECLVFILTFCHQKCMFLWLNLVSRVFSRDKSCSIFNWLRDIQPIRYPSFGIFNQKMKCVYKRKSSESTGNSTAAHLRLGTFSPKEFILARLNHWETDGLRSHPCWVKLLVKERISDLSG